MMGAEVLNKVYLADFRKVSKVYVFLPGCMTHKGCECKAIESSTGYICQHCSMDCEISQIDTEISTDNIKVRVIYHESEINHQTVSSEENTGIIGIACILNLISGGFKARRLGYIPQCVLLDYCGCSQHWNLEKGRIITSINKVILKNKL